MSSGVKLGLLIYHLIGRIAVLIVHKKFLKLDFVETLLRTNNLSFFRFHRRTSLFWTLFTELHVITL